MRGLTDEERGALRSNSHILTPHELNERLLARGLLYVEWEREVRPGWFHRHLEPTELGKLALRLDSAARGIGVPCP
jgi:hypothetical protein